MSERHRFPAPWSVEETDCCFIVKDRDSQALAFIYFVDEPGHRLAAGLLTRDEARRIASNIAKLPSLLGLLSKLGSLLHKIAAEFCTVN